MRETSFSVTLTDEDLGGFGLDPAKITDKKFQQIVEAIEQIFQEDYWEQITKQAIVEVEKADDA